MPLIILNTCILQVFRAVSLVQARMLLGRHYWSQISVDTISDNSERRVCVCGGIGEESQQN